MNETFVIENEEQKSIWSIGAELTNLHAANHSVEEKLDEIEKKMDRILDLLEPKEMSISNEYSLLKIGKVTNEHMKRFELGPYSKNSTPDSLSV